MKDLKAIRGADLVRRMIAEGEHEHQDFKFAISDARKIARSISAFANNSGGRLLIGVKDNGVIAGVRNEEDVYMVELAAERYCRPAQQVEFKAYKIEGPVRVIVAEIAQAPARPVAVAEADGSLRAYYRVADENIVADPLMVRAWQMSGSPEALPALSDRHYAFAALFADSGTTMQLRAAALALHIGIATAEDMAARLVAAGILEFVHTPSGFLLRGTRE